MAKWIKNATANKGGLHRSLGISEDKTIPAKTLAKAAKKGGIIGKQARLAETLKGMHKGSVNSKTPTGHRNMG